MKLTVFFLLTAFIHVSASVYSQQTKLSISLKDATVRDVLRVIEDQSDFFFLYKNENIDVNRTVSVDIKEKTVEYLLSQLFKGTTVEYEVVNRQIVLIDKEKGNFNSLSQQQKSITGKVTDSSGSSLPGVSVVVKGTTNGTISDGNGSYSLSNVPENATVQFSFVGMKGQEIAVGGKSTINVSMEEDAIGIEEVVAVGYGTMKKSDLTGSVVSVKSDQLVSFPVSGAVQALQGRAAGVQISSNNGDPGSSMRVRVRGGTSINASSDPIFVVDGFVGGILPPPEDIESIEILKDASATAIYGSRGANGVIMVTTKRGTSGKTRIEFNTSYSAQNEIKRLDLLNAEQYTAITKEAFPNYVSSGDNTDWQDVVFRTGAIQNHQLSFSGGNDNVNYYLSGLFYDQEGDYHWFRI